MSRNARRQSSFRQLRNPFGLHTTTGLTPKSSLARKLAVAAVLAFLLAGRAWAATEPYVVGTAGPGCIDRWVVSTRDVQPCGDPIEALNHLAIWHREPTGWVPYSLAAFIDSIDSDVPLWFYVHGSFTSAHASAKESEKLFVNVGSGLPPFRGILWLWPGDFQFGESLREQVNRAIANSRAEAFYLATFIQSLRSTAQVQLVGHSLGCQIVAATLQTLAMSKRTEQPLAETCESSPLVRAALLAPTIDPCSFCASGEFRYAPIAADRLLVTYNPDDLALVAYELIHQRQALGLRGLSAGVAATQPHGLFELNANQAVGCKHAASTYFGSPVIAGWLRALFIN